MRLSNFRNTATPAAILALIAKVESLNRSNLELSRRYDEQRLQEQRLDSALEREKSKVESLAADAERYRWLRHGDNDELVIQHGPVAPDYHWLPRNERLDEMIDARAILAAAGVSLEAK